MDYLFHRLGREKCGKGTAADKSAYVVLNVLCKMDTCHDTLIPLYSVTCGGLHVSYFSTYIAAWAEILKLLAIHRLVMEKRNYYVKTMTYMNLSYICAYIRTSPSLLLVSRPLSLRN